MVNHPNRSKKHPIDWAQIIRDAVFAKVIDALIEDGFRLEISNQDGGGLFIYAAEDGGEKPEDGYEFWVKIVPANGPATLISDYTTNLESTLKDVLAFAEMFDHPHNEA